MNILQRLSEMNKTNNTLKLYCFTVFFSTSNLGGLPNFHGERYYDIMGIDGIEGEYMTKEEVVNYIEKNKIVVKAGDTFNAERPVHGKTTHKCTRIKESKNGIDNIFHGYYVDEYNILINPEHVVSVV